MREPIGTSTVVATQTRQDVRTGTKQALNMTWREVLKVAPSKRAAYDREQREWTQFATFHEFESAATLETRVPVTVMCFLKSMKRRTLGRVSSPTLADADTVTLAGWQSTTPVKSKAASDRACDASSGHVHVERA